MGKSIPRGGNISLNKAAPGVTRVGIGLGWDAAPAGGTQIDLDASAFLLGAQGEVPDDDHFIFFNNLVSPDGAVRHQGGNATGEGEGDDEVILIDLDKVTPAIQKIAFTVTIYAFKDRRQSFGMVRNAFIRVFDPKSRNEIARYDLTEQFGSESALVFGEIYRRGAEWKFRAVGQGFNGGLMAMAATFGVKVDQEDADDPSPAGPPQGHSVSGKTSQPSRAAPSPFAQTGGSSLSSPQHRTASEPTTGVGIDGLRYERHCPGAFTLLKVHLKAGESVKAEAGAMVAMSPTVSIEGRAEGGIMAGIGRMMAGEKFFFQTLTAERGPGFALLAPAGLGEVHAIDLDGSVRYSVQKDGFLAGSPGLQISTEIQNLARGLLSGEGFFILGVHGRGTLFVSSFGAIHPIDIPAGQDVIVDNHHLVAWPSTVHYDVELASRGIINAFTSGESLVCRFHGPGRILLQSRNLSSFASWAGQFAPAQRQAQRSPAGRVANILGNLTD